MFLFLTFWACSLIFCPLCDPAFVLRPPWRYAPLGVGLLLHISSRGHYQTSFAEWSLGFLGSFHKLPSLSGFVVFPRNFLSSSAVQVTLNLAPPLGPVNRLCVPLKFV